MESHGSFIRSAARATFSAYRSVPVRWRLAGGSAALTAVILAGFAIVAGYLTDSKVNTSFQEAIEGSLTKLYPIILQTTTGGQATTCRANLADLAADDNGQIRLLDDFGVVLCSSRTGGRLGAIPLNEPYLDLPPQSFSGDTALYQDDGYEVAGQYIHLKPYGEGWLLYARPLSQVATTESKVQVILGLGVLGGSILALLAGLYVAQRAMRPIVELTDAAREIERTRDPTLRIPHPEADDEVAELARTLEGMLGGLSASRAETEAALTRQREFVADASHELRTPLTSVLANLELLAEELDGEQAESARSALRSTQRMRRLVGDLLLLARADAQRATPHRQVDLADVLTDAASELGPVAADHELTVFAGRAMIDGQRDDLHRVVLNLLENALRHTPPGTAVRASTAVDDGVPVIVVEDSGPGIALELRDRVFDRFVRGGGDASSRGTGLGLAIVRAVADAHGAELTLTVPDDAPGTRFELRFVRDRATEPVPASTPI